MHAGRRADGLEERHRMTWALPGARGRSGSPAPRGRAPDGEGGGRRPRMGRIGLDWKAMGWGRASERASEDDDDAREVEEGMGAA
eukprot:scaffold5582_cov444-Prasinococcus_capsulatus_cf.AAC.6